jgi:hypothetical protein
MGYSKVLRDSELYNDICKDWLVSAGSGVAIGVLASFVVLGLNIVFGVVCTVTNDWSRYQSVTTYQNNLMKKIFISKVLNTAGILYMLARYNEFLAVGILFNGPYRGFERGWYAIVGGAMVTNLMINSVTSVQGWGMNIAMRIARCCLACTIKTQDELLELYTNPEFNISDRFATLLMTTYSTMIFSAGMPALNFFAVIYCFVTYWTDKAVLLRGSRRPPVYNIDMAATASQLLLFAIPIHLYMSISMFSDQCTFPSLPLGGSLGSYAAAGKSQASSQSSTSPSIFDSMTLQSTWVHSCMFVVIVTLLLLQLVLQIIGATFGEAWAFLRTAFCPKKGMKIVPEEGEDVEAEDTADLSMGRFAMSAWNDPDLQRYLEATCPPTSYSLESRPDWKRIMHYLHEPATPSSPAVET